MSDLNSVCLVGRLTRDVDVNYLQSGTAVGKLSIAVNRSVKKNDQWIEEVSFFDVSLFGRVVEGLKQYLMKGKQICVHGSLKQDRWEKDGSKFTRVQVIADSIQLLGGNSGHGTGQAQKPAVAVEGDGFEATGFVDDGFAEDIPF